MPSFEDPTNFGREDLRQRIKKSPAWADSLAIGLIINRFQLASAAMPLTKYDPRNDMHMALMSTNLYNRVLAAIGIFSANVATQEGALLKISRVPPFAILQTLQQDLHEGVLGEEDFSLASENLDEKDGYWARKYFPDALVDAWIRSGFFDMWIDHQLGKLIMLEERMKTQKDPTYVASVSELKERITELKREEASAGPSSGTIAELVQAAVRGELEAMPSRQFIVGIPQFHLAIGGMHRVPLFSEGSTLIGAPKGCGKTVLATQIASSLSAGNIPVLFFTTEETKLQLTYRFLSQLTRIPYAELRSTYEINQHAKSDGIGVMTETSEQSRGMARLLPLSIRQDASRMERIFRALPSLRLLDVVELTDRSYSADEIVEEEVVKGIQRFHTKFGIETTPFIIFDWVGGALANDPKTELRLLYKNVVDRLEYTSRALNTHAVSFCQLNVATALGKMHPDMRDISESKSMPDRVANFVAITALQERSNNQETQSQLKAEGDPQQGQAIFSRLQYFVCSKSRYGIPTAAPVMREFEFQRFATPPHSKGGLQRPPTTQPPQGGLPDQA